MSANVVWHRLPPDALDYALDIGARRVATQRTRNLEGAVAASQMNAKAEVAFASLAHIHMPVVNPPEPGYSFRLSRYRVLVRANGRVAIKDLRTPTGRGELRTDRFDIITLAVTPGTSDPWVGLVGWISADSYLKHRQHRPVQVDRDGAKSRIDMWVVPRDRLNEIADLPGWPATAPKATPAPAYQSAEGQQNRLL